MKKKMLSLICGVLSLSSFAHEKGQIKIYDAQFVPQILNMFKPGKLVLVDGQSQTLLVSNNAKILHKNLSKVRNYFYEEFGRKSWNNKGSPILASVNMNRYSLIDLLGTRQNAAWSGERFLFGAGRKDGLDDFEKALDVVAHEYTHAVIQTSSNLEYKGESGALNEHLADVFGMVINNKNNPYLTNPYSIGSSILHGEYAKKYSALRDMMDPKKGLDPQPEHMDDLKTKPFNIYAKGCVASNANDLCGVHVLSGIPNKAAALIMSSIGVDETSKLYYKVMTKGLSEKSEFKDLRIALMKECQNLSSDVCDIVDDALNSVGITAEN
jgi:bacillolysin